MWPPQPDRNECAERETLARSAKLAPRASTHLAARRSRVDPARPPVFGPHTAMCAARVGAAPYYGTKVSSTASERLVVFEAGGSRYHACT